MSPPGEKRTNIEKELHLLESVSLNLAANRKNIHKSPWKTTEVSSNFPKLKFQEGQKTGNILWHWLTLISGHSERQRIFQES